MFTVQNKGRSGTHIKLWLEIGNMAERKYTAWGCLKHWRATFKSSHDVQKKIRCIGVPFNKAWSFELARGCKKNILAHQCSLDHPKSKKDITEGDSVKGVNKAKARIQECATAKVRMIPAAFEPGVFKYAASQECINNATVMTLRTNVNQSLHLCVCKDQCP